MEFSARLKQANSRLKSAKIKLRVEIKGNRLVLRGTLPGCNGSPDHQQRIYTGLSATPIGLQEAERKAKQCHVDLETGKFSWDNWKQREPVSDKCRDWIERLEEDYFSCRERNPKSLTTWNSSYMRGFKRLPQDQALTGELLTAKLLETPPDSHNRRMFAMAFSYLAKFAGIEVDLSRYRGTYQFGEKTDRLVPVNQQIEENFKKITNPQWAYAYGLMATYGLRPHEVWYASIDGDICIVEDGKTGGRKVWAFPREWIDLFLIRTGVLPINNATNNKDRGAYCSRAFKRYGIDFKPYDLRHAWAIRTLEMGLDLTLSAQQMGHSLAIHSKTYHQWISDRHHQEAYDRINLLSQPDNN